MLPVPLCTGGGSHRGTAGTRLFLSVGGLCGVLSTSGAGQSCFSPAFGWLGGRVLVFLGQGEEVAEPEGMENKLSEWGPHSSGAPHPFLGPMPRSLSNPMGLLVIKLVSGAGPSPRLPPPLPKAKEPHFILWASSQLAWTCCRAWRIGVWLKTRGGRKGEQSAVWEHTAPKGAPPAPSPPGSSGRRSAGSPAGRAYSSAWCWSG